MILRASGVDVGRQENRNAFSKGNIGAARNRVPVARIRDLCGYYFASCKIFYNQLIS